MPRNSHNMLLISTTSNEWPQNQIDEKKNLIMEKPTQEQQQQQQQQQQQALKCPRCDSSNTKFCYYNNYSLSQPRHFCKACKRYWTRGGTLRNVPVGGGCRKNKKLIKRSQPISNHIDSISPLPNTSSSNPNSAVQLLPSTSNHISPPLFYGFPSNPSELNNLPYSSMINSRVYDLQPQLSAPGLGFSNGFNPTNSNSLLSNYPIFGSSTSPSFVASNSFLGLAANYEDDMQMLKEVKMEETQKRSDLINENHANNYQSQIEQLGSSSDASLLWMLDPANIGSSAL